LVLAEAWVAATPGGVVLRFTVGVDTTRQGVAGVDTLVVDTSQLAGAFVVHRALAFGRHCADTSSSVGVAGHAMWTDTLEATLFVDAARRVRARVAGTFVDIHTTLVRIALVAGETQTLGRVRGRTLGVYAAREPLTWALALVGIGGVSEVGRRTHTLSGLNALFVGAAVVVGDTLDLGRRAEARRVSAVARRTSAGEPLRLIDTLRSVAAHLAMARLHTLVYVLTGAIVRGSRALGAGTVADSAGDCDTLSTRWTLALGTIG